MRAMPSISQRQHLMCWSRGSIDDSYTICSLTVMKYDLIIIYVRKQNEKTTSLSDLMNNRDLQAALDAQQAIKPKQVMGQRQSNTPLIMLTRQSDQNFGHSAITPQQSRNAIRNMFNSAQTTRNSSKSPFLERLRSQQAGVKDQRVKINKLNYFTQAKILENSLGDIQKSLDSLIVGTSAPILEHQNKQHQQQQHATIVTPQRQDSSTSTATLIEETEKRKKRFIFLSEKIREIKQREGEKRTFMTAPNILDVSISSDEERQDRKVQVKLEPIKEIVIVPKEVVSEYRSMLQEVLIAQKSVRQDTTDLEEIRQMIRQTRDNIDQHIGTVDVLKSKLINISRRSKLAVEHKNPPPLVASPRQVLKTSNSHRVLPALFRMGVVICEVIRIKLSIYVFQRSSHQLQGRYALLS